MAIALIVQNDVTTESIDLKYHDGEKYPALIRDAGMPDYLDEVSQSLAPRR